MFDSSFGELGLIFVVALVVLGPERLPQVIRSTVRLIGIVRAMAHSVKEEVSKELQLSELKDEIRAIEQKEREKLTENISLSKQELREVEKSVTKSVSTIKSDIQNIEAEYSTSSRK